jgi:hypothetical protein
MRVYMQPIGTANIIHARQITPCMEFAFLKTIFKEITYI